MPDSSWFIGPASSTQPQLRLFCLPYAGGGAAAYARWNDLLPPTVEVWRVQLPGRENRWREKPFTDLALLVETLASEMRPLLDVPFAFFGHSLGALTSFELARQVRRQFGLLPVHLLVSGRWAPHLPSPDSALHVLPDAEFVETLRRRYNNIPDAIANDPELMEIFLPLLRADITLLDTYHYVPESPLACPITAYGGDSDLRVAPDALEAWRTHTTQSFAVQMFPGGHFYLQAERVPLLRSLSRELAAVLDHG